MHRRRVLTLSAGVVFILSGCSERGSGGIPVGTGTSTATEVPTDSPAPTPAPARHLGGFVLWNDDDERHRVGLRISRDGTVLVDEQRDLGPGVAADVENPIETQGVYSVVATVDGERRAEREWRVSNCDSIEYLQVYVDDERVAVRTKRQTIDPHPTC
jgi:hypothetical protein